jgi:putative acetyltransferase
VTNAWQIVDDDLSGAEIQALLKVHFAGMLANSPPGSCHFLDLVGLNAPDVSFWSIHRGDALAGCGALKMHDAQLGEVKSMRTASAYLRQGVATRMLEHILATARARGLERLSLETGTGAAFEPAMRLYRAFEFAECPPFGDYRTNPHSRFMTRKL